MRRRARPAAPRSPVAPSSACGGPTEVRHRTAPALCVCVVALLAAGAPGRAAAQRPSLEYQVKAAYLAKFVPFVEWPPAALAPGAPVNLCVAGDDPFGPALTALSRQL